jgi:hypothetical protein
MRDLKEALGSGRKPDTTHVRKTIRTYIARACEYGSAKYERANFMRAGDHATVEAEIDALRVYARAAKDHIEEFLEAIERHQSTDPHFADVDGLRVAIYAEDTDSKPDCPVGASGLPHLAHGAASLMMLLTKLTMGKWLPEDPGTPWVSAEPATAVDPRYDHKAPLSEYVAIPAGQTLKVPHTVAPPDGRPRCDHGLLIGRRCTGCGTFAVPPSYPPPID